MDAIIIAWSIGGFIINSILGIVLMLGVYKFMEKRVPLGAISGTVAGAVVIYLQATLGEKLLTVTVGEMKILVITACLGAVIGVVGTVLTVKPEL